MKTHCLTPLLLAGLLGSAAAHAATITPINADPAGVGLNDTTPATPVGGNPGTTVGAQRRITYQFAADLWGSILQSNANEIKVRASFTPYPPSQCTATGGVLGSAGPWNIWRDFENAPVPGIWYHSALASAIAGRNLNAEIPPPNDIDIASRFNPNIGGVNTDGSACMTGSGWYYGLDGNTPGNRISFLDVVMHEIGHGLGFSGFVNKTTGDFPVYDDTGVPRSDAYTHVAYDNVSNLRFDDPAMTSSLRATTMKTPGRLVWDGSTVKADAAILLDDLVLLRASGTLNAGYENAVAGFPPQADASNFTGSVQLVNDGVADTADACQPLPAGSLTGKIAFINRGSCGFEPKVVNAQNAGAIGAIVGNVSSSANPEGLITMAHDPDPAVVATIPAVHIVLSSADAIRAALPGVNVTMGAVPGRLAGADTSGRVRLYAPTVVAGGSTFSHYDTAVAPNVLMEPFINDSLAANFNVDLTPSLFKDMGWGVATGNATIKGCDTTVPLNNTGLILGANIQAGSKLCLNHASGSRSIYLRCMSDQASRLRKQGLLTNAQFSKVRNCATTVTP